MGRKFYIKPTEVSSQSSLARPTKVNDQEPVSFNLRRLCCRGEKFNYLERDTNYYVKLLDRLKEVSGMTRKEMIITNQRPLRCHQIDFIKDAVSEETFGLGEDIDQDAWQFQLSSNEHGRVHGYFVGNVFFIVWLDPDHELYPG